MAPRISSSRPPSSRTAHAGGQVGGPGRTDSPRPDMATDFYGASQNPLDHENRVHYFCVMKNITLSADQHLIELAREEARARKTTLNALFREWLEEISRSDERRKKAEEVIQRMSQYDSGGPFTRDELNER